MLPDQQLERATARLANFRKANEGHHTTLAEILENYAVFMDDYKRLKSDLEEERDARERYKQLARGQERNPFVLVLIDGDGYVFEDDLVSNGAEGGRKAAHLLDNAVKNSLRSLGLENCRIMVRVYANLAGLSKALSKMKLIGAELRSLSPFTASFTRSNELFDFVDAGDPKENAASKVRAMFQQFSESTQCRHIYFAGCHDVSYIAELIPYTGKRDRITLVRTQAFQPEFAKLGLRVEEFPTIFRSLPLERSLTVPPYKPPHMKTTEPSAGSTFDDNVPVCKHFLNNNCKYGKNCNKSHILPHTNGQWVAAPTSGNPTDLKWSLKLPGSKTPLPWQTSQISKNGNHSTDGGFNSADPGVLQSNQNFAVSLPRADSIPPGYIAINKDQQRLDAYEDPITPEERAVYHQRTAIQKPCNNYHLLGHCSAGDKCKFDHSPLKSTVLKSLKKLVRTNPCAQKGACRAPGCISGHICQRMDCTWRDGRGHCKFGATAHFLDFNVAQFVPGTVSWDSSIKNTYNYSYSGQSPDSGSARNDSDSEGFDKQGTLLKFDDDDDDDDYVPAD